MATYRVEVGYRVETEVVDNIPNDKTSKSTFERTTKSGVAADKVKQTILDLISAAPENITELNAYAYQEEDLLDMVAKY